LVVVENNIIDIEKTLENDYMKEKEISEKMKDVLSHIQNDIATKDDLKDHVDLTWKELDKAAVKID
jgi:hypothetical protein